MVDDSTPTSPGPDMKSADVNPQETKTVERMDAGTKTSTQLSQLRQMHGLLQAEIERLRINLDNLRLLQGPKQRELIGRQVAALDERQDALADLERLVRQAEADMQSGSQPSDADSLH